MAQRGKGWWIHSKGYVYVRVSKDHPCERCGGRGWAPLHLLVFYYTHGCTFPAPGCHVHHDDENKSNVMPWNLLEKSSDVHGRIHLSPERARILGRKGGKATARMRRRAKRLGNEVTC